MGFFDKLSNVTNEMKGKLEEKNNEIKKAMQKLESYSDSKLKEIIKDDSFFGYSAIEKK